MLELTRGDILKADAEALVNTVNCVGVMGRGIALQFRKAFPENFKAYKSVCDKKQLHPGTMLVYDLNRFQNPRYIINFPTKRHWKGKSKLEDIKSGLESLVQEISKRNIRSIAIPPLGCGLGGLDWIQVKRIIEKVFTAFPDVHVLLYEPAGAPVADVMVKEEKAPKMTVGRAALLGLMNRYLKAVMDPSISLLEIHKLMYFMQESGEKLRLNYTKALYGPYAKNLRHVLNAIEGHFTIGFADASDQPDIQIQLVSGAAKKADIFLEKHYSTREKFDRVADLIKGFETPFGMELLSTVHWVATREKAETPAQAIEKTYSWSVRKRMFKENHIKIVWGVLERKEWLPKNVH
ncbi:MAG: macro domain-containing protein [Sedimentisphaerales bacterium]|nr:macro domain-containing protein [Sedimentisphaerales bacterium]